MRRPVILLLTALAVPWAGCQRGAGLTGDGFCGDGRARGAEECDGADLAGATCAGLGWEGGEIACARDCRLDTTACTGTGPVCGNGAVEFREDCDGTALAETTCASLGFASGELSCSGACTFDTSGCSNVGTCGNGTIDGAEQCEAGDLRGASCASIGLASGVLGCAADCTYDTSGCAGAICGDGRLSGPEECDGADLAGASCVGLGFAGGALACGFDCRFDRSACVAGRCGNGVVEPGELCDGADLGAQDCAGLGFAGGTLACDDRCQFDARGCVAQICGNGIAEGSEACDGADLAGADCVARGFTGGTLACAGDCSFDTAGCHAMCTAAGGAVSCADRRSADTGASAAATDAIDGYRGLGCRPWRMDGPEVVYALDPGGAGEGVQVDLGGLSTDLDLIVLVDDGSGCHGGLPCIGWSDQTGQQAEQLQFYAQPNTTYYVIVDGYSGGSGPYQLDFMCAQVEICDNGSDDDGDGDIDCADRSCTNDPLCTVRQIYELFPASDPADTFDLDGTTVTFTPSATSLSGYAFSTTSGVTSYPSVPGTGTSTQVVTFAQADDSVQVQIPNPNPREFPFFGQVYRDLWINSHGSVTFGQGDSDFAESRGALLAGPPRVAGHWDRFDVTAGGTVTYDVFTDRVVVTYDRIPDAFLSGSHSFQIELHRSGVIAITNLSHSGVDGLVGISEGGGTQGPGEVDFFVPPPVGGVWERFDPATGDDFDLDGVTLVFAPAAVPEGYTHQVAPNGAGGLPDAPGSGDLSSRQLTWTGGDAAQEITFGGGHTISYFGQVYASAFVGSNGYVTFGGGDGSWTNDAAHHFDRPRVSGLFFDWEPQNGGQVWVDEFTAGGYRLVVSFVDVPHFATPNPTATFQMAIASDGAVTVSYAGVPTRGGLVGLSAGGAGTIPAQSDLR